MEVLNNFEELNKVIKNKIAHSKYKKSQGSCTRYFYENSFKSKTGEFFRSKIQYLNCLKPILYYEWSRYKQKNERGIFVGFLSQLYENRFSNIDFEYFDLDESNFFKKIDSGNEVLNKFCFDDLKLTLYISHYPERDWSNPTSLFLKDLIKVKDDELQFKIYLFNENTGKRYEIIKNDDDDDENDDDENDDDENDDENVNSNENPPVFSIPRLPPLGLGNSVYHTPTLRPRPTQTLRPTPTPTPTPINADQTFKSEECVICYTEEPNILFCNCGHIAICAECDSLSISNKCPVCRQENTIKRKILNNLK